MATINIKYIGHASFCFESDSGTVIYYDPWLDESPVACMKRDEVEKVDIVISSHGHNDHVRDASKFVIKLKSVLLVTM
jgi:L-ascorbate metabolism protein UlaG (beta-lactamase superfamily)